MSLPSEVQRNSPKRTGPPDDTYGRAVGDWAAVWFDGWVDRIKGRAKGWTFRWRVLGHIQVAQACLANADWHIEDAINNLSWATKNYRRYAKLAGIVGCGRDAHDITRYLITPGVTQDGKPYLRARLGAVEEQRRRTVALRALRVAQFDMARWIEQTSPLTNREQALPSSFRVPGLRLDWRTNPYVTDWPDMPYGYTRPMLALELQQAGIKRFPYAFTKKDPTLSDWPEKTDLFDDIWEGVKDVGEWFVDKADDFTDWVCENQVLVAAVVTAVVVAVETVVTCLTTACSTTAAVAASASAQYATIQGGLSTACGVKAAGEIALLASDWDGHIQRIVSKAAEATSFSGALDPVLPSPLPNSAVDLTNLLVAKALVLVMKQAEPLVDAGVQELKRMLDDIAKSSDAGAALAQGLSSKFNDKEGLKQTILAKVRKTATPIVRDFVSVRVNVLFPAQARPADNKTAISRKIFADVANIKLIGGPATTARDTTRREILAKRGRSGYYGAAPTWVNATPVEMSVPVQNALLAGVPIDSINEALYQDGPENGLSPPFERVSKALTALTVYRIETFPGSLQSITQGGAGVERAALGASRWARVVAEVPGAKLVPNLNVSYHAEIPFKMFGPNPSGEYAVVRTKLYHPTVTPGAAEAVYARMAKADAAYLIQTLRRNPNAPLARLYNERAHANFAAAEKKTADLAAAAALAAKKKRKAAALAAKKPAAERSAVAPVLITSLAAGALWLYLQA